MACGCSEEERGWFAGLDRVIRSDKRRLTD